jgi:hypothetical protein
MSRSGYSDDCENIGLWRSTVDRAINGKRGQAFLREMLDALDAMPVKRLIKNELVTESGEACALGAVALRRGLDVSDVDESEPDDVASSFGISRALACEIAYENDEHRTYDFKLHEYVDESPEQCWERMRKWIVSHILPTEDEFIPLPAADHPEE